MFHARQSRVLDARLGGQLAQTHLLFRSRVMKDVAESHLGHEASLDGVLTFVNNPRAHDLRHQRVS